MAKRKNRFWRRTRDAAAYVLFRACAASVAILPETAAVLAGRAVGWLFWRVSPERRRRAEANIEKAMGGELTRDRQLRLARQSFIHMGLTAVETLWSEKRVRDRRSFEARIPVDGAAAVKAELAKGRGALGITVHLGNWELFGARMANVLGKISVVALPGKNRRVGDHVVRMRERMGMRVVDSGGGVRPIVTALRNGAFLAFLIDRHVKTAFVRTKFFGRDVATTRAVAALARRLDLPVFIGYALRDGYSFRHHGAFEGPLELVRTDDEESDVRVNTQLFNDRLEAIIRKHPEQWLWVQKRWKLADKLDRAKAEAKGADQTSRTT